MNDLKQFRTRWRRWLGQKCRKDKPYWTTLLNSSWMNWAGTILFRNNKRIGTQFMDREKVKELFGKAIDLANMQELRVLDNIYCTERMAK